jgi:hypothetical protein
MQTGDPLTSPHSALSAPGSSRLSSSAGSPLSSNPSFRPKSVQFELPEGAPTVDRVTAAPMGSPANTPSTVGLSPVVRTTDLLRVARREHRQSKADLSLSFEAASSSQPSPIQSPTRYVPKAPFSDDFIARLTSPTPGQQDRSAGSPLSPLDAARLAAGRRTPGARMEELQQKIDQFDLDRSLIL